MGEQRARSWSQKEQYDTCPYQFYLARIEKRWERPAAWTAMGTAVHAAGEAYELSERNLPLEGAQSKFREVYAEEINKLLDETPNLKYWESSGPYDGEQDIPRRWKIGQEHVARYIEWYEKHPSQRPWRTPEGKLAVEIPFTIWLGSVKVRGVIDYLGSLALDPEEIAPRDTKSGANPGKLLQLKIYGIAVEDYFKWLGQPREVTRADFFMTKTGKPTVFQNLKQVSRDELVVMFEELDAKVNAGDFPPKPGPACARCGVRTFCKYREG